MQDCILKCWVLSLDVKKTPKNPAKKSCNSLAPPLPPQKNNPSGLLGVFKCKSSWFFLWVYVKIKPIIKAKAALSKHTQGQAQLWVLNKARKRLSSMNYPRNRNRKSPTESLKAPVSKLHWAALSIWSFPSWKKLFLSLSGQFFFALHTGFQKHNKILQKSVQLLLEQKWMLSRCYNAFSWPGALQLEM